MNSDEAQTSYKRPEQIRDTLRCRPGSPKVLFVLRNNRNMVFEVI